MSQKDTKPTCPQCRKPAPPQGNKHFPFCSERCQLLDLGKWVKGDYKVAGERTDLGKESDNFGMESN